jgi:hypothetical protein
VVVTILGGCRVRVRRSGVDNDDVDHRIRGE